MATFPRISRRCPYQQRRAAAMDGGLCTLCDRAVYDLTGMDDEGRAAFMAGCAEDVCISYRLPKAAAAIAAAAMAGVPFAAVAGEPAPPPEAPADVGEIVGVMSFDPPEPAIRTITFPDSMFTYHPPTFPLPKRMAWPQKPPEPKKDEPAKDEPEKKD